MKQLTPREYASELAMQFEGDTCSESYNHITNYLSKKCAIRLVSSLINELTMGGQNILFNYKENRLNYLYETRKELEKY